MNRKIIDFYGILTLTVLMLLAIIPNASAQDPGLWFGGLFCMIYMVVFIVFILIAIWVYRDAESRGQSGVLWLIVVLVGGLIGLIVYLVLRSGWPEVPPGGQPYGPPPAPYRCPTCSAAVTFVPQYNRWYCTVCQKYL